ncbi:hypothetical protein [Streptomyces violaceus]|uniref:DUF1508 domain-containing protein n=1 Tax=Streptomyces violaceus TaxID=1936 RepID=A0ABY9U5Z9_STRVL|nr:hypothetical protein [Streptomyces janthinus]WND18220.1 hypothetical protein RI060_13120 [Streptomyces janthinus]GGS74950.1 hypothetical protein GCM10010270_53390 [Streptomyces janthinus]
MRQQILGQNEGFELKTSYSGKNFTEYRWYRITGGELRIRSSGKTSWADSRFDREDVATDEQTHRFLREHLAELNTDGL